MVRVHYGDGVAIHTGPESCTGGREVVGEALTGGHAGQALSGVSKFPGADAVAVAEGNIARCDIASDVLTRRRQRPWTVCTSSAREPGDPHHYPGGPTSGTHREDLGHSR